MLRMVKRKFEGVGLELNTQKIKIMVCKKGRTIAMNR